MDNVPLALDGILLRGDVVLLLHADAEPHAAADTELVGDSKPEEKLEVEGNAEEEAHTVVVAEPQGLPSAVGKCDGKQVLEKDIEAQGEALEETDAQKVCTIGLLL